MKLGTSRDFRVIRRRQRNTNCTAPFIASLPTKFSFFLLPRRAPQSIITRDDLLAWRIWFGKIVFQRKFGLWSVKTSKGTQIAGVKSESGKFNETDYPDRDHYLNWIYLLVSLGERGGGRILRFRRADSLRRSRNGDSRRLEDSLPEKSEEGASN